MPLIGSKATYQQGRYLGRLGLAGGGTVYAGRYVTGDPASMRAAGPIDPGLARATGRYAVEYRGSPFRREPPRGASGSIVGPYRQAAPGGRTGTTDFNLVWYGDRLLSAVDQAVVDAMNQLAQEMREVAVSISPVETGSYAQGLEFSVGATPGTPGPRGGRGEPGSLTIIGRVVYRGGGAQERDPRAYSMFVEFGGGHTPPYAVLRRTLDWAVPRLVVLIRDHLGAGALTSPGAALPETA